MTPEDFFSLRSVNASDASDSQLRAATLLQQLRALTLELSRPKLSSLITDPTWGLSFRALGRVAEYAEGALVASVASPVAGEIVARTAVESSINYLYIMVGSRPERLYSYFNSYLCQEERQNVKWEEELANLSDTSEIEIHRNSIRNKRSALRTQRQFVDESFAQMGVDITKPESWGSLSNRFDAIDRAIEYRTVYAALCSQAHGDAEDLINEFVIKSQTDAELEKRLLDETRAFSWFAVTLSLRQYSAAVAAYLIAFDLAKDTQELERVRTIARELAEEAVEQISTPRSGSDPTLPRGRS